jgi:ribonuclease VapC
MIIDSSAIIAIVFREPGYEKILDILLSSPFTGIGTPTLSEAAIVTTARLGKDAAGLLDRLIHELEITEVPFGSDHWREAASAYYRYGKGRHPAALNFGDCMCYAVARLADLPLLCKGDDFRKTDLAIVQYE